MNEREKLQKYTLLPAVDENALQEMLQIFSPLLELPCDEWPDCGKTGDLRPDQIQPIADYSVLSSYIHVLSPEGISIPILLPPREEKS